jgi:hypothetical protein
MKSKYILLRCLMLAFVFAGCDDEQKYAARFSLKSITVTPATVTLTEGFTQQLTATTDPAGNDAVLEWQSENPTIATVSGEGLVTALRGGTTVIKVMAGGAVASVSVTVDAVQDIVLTPASALLEIGGTQQLVAVTVPEAVPGIVLGYESSDASVVTVSNTGLLTAVAPGNATITVQAGRTSRQMTIKVNDPSLPEQKLWKKLDASSEWNTTVADAIDGNPDNLWHSDPALSLPQWIAVDMGAMKHIDGFLFTNRQAQDQFAHPKRIVFEVSNNGTNWETALDVAELPDLLRQQVLPLPQRKTARYFKITIYSTWNDAPYTYIGDVCIYNGQAPEPNPNHKTDWTVIESSSTFADLDAKRLIDNDINSPWHSNVGDGQPWAIIDLKIATIMKGIYFTGRQGGAGDIGSSPKHIIFSVSNDKQNWETLLDVTELPNLRTMQTLDASTPKTGRYLKIEIKSTWSGDPYSYIGEIDIKTSN